MNSENWLWFAPLALGLIAFVYVAATVEAETPESSTTKKLRLMFFIAALELLYASPLIFIYRLEGWRTGPFWLNGMFCLLLGWGFVIYSATATRESLESASDSMSRPTYDFKDPNAKPDITPAERVRRALGRENDNAQE